MEIINLLKKNRPNLSDKSLKVYKSVLINLYKKMLDKNTEPQDIKWFFEEQKEIMEYLEKFPRDNRKLRLAALVVLTEEQFEISQIYKNQMNQDIRDYNEEQKLQKKTTKQEENWITQEEVEKIWKDMQFDVQHLFLKKSRLNDKEYFKLQDFVMLSLYVLNPPRRSLDYTEFKLHENPGREWNGIDGEKFIFNKYKTSKTYGEQQVDINSKLLWILKQWKKKNPQQEWLLVTPTGKKMTPPEMTMRFNKIFGKKISVSMLRHIYISDKVLKNMPQLTELQNIATKMGHSINNQILYNKFDV